MQQQFLNLAQFSLLHMTLIAHILLYVVNEILIWLCRKFIFAMLLLRETTEIEKYFFIKKIPFFAGKSIEKVFSKVDAAN